MGSNFDQFFFQFRFNPVGLEKHQGTKVVISGSIESYEKYAAFLLRKGRQAKAFLSNGRYPEVSEPFRHVPWIFQSTGKTIDCVAT